MPKFLRNAALWVRDWVRAAMHDPDFWSYRIATIRLIRLKARLNPCSLEIDISWWNCPRFKLHHPSEWTEWGRTTIDYAYPHQAIDYDNIPF